MNDTAPTRCWIENCKRPARWQPVLELRHASRSARVEVALPVGVCDPCHKVTGAIDFVRHRPELYRPAADRYRALIGRMPVVELTRLIYRALPTLTRSDELQPVE